MSKKELLKEAAWFVTAVVVIAGSVDVAWAMHPLASAGVVAFWTALYLVVGVAVGDDPEEWGDIPIPSHLAEDWNSPEDEVYDDA